MMIISSPVKSLTSMEVTQCFPCKLVDASHDSFLLGNITLAAQHVNLRGLAVCNVACLVSKLLVEDIGLSYPRLLNLRYGAISYQGGSCIPSLGYFETRVSFATSDALNVGTLCALQAT